MREFVFTVEYEMGVDVFMDLFIEYPDLYSKTAACHVTSETMWRLDRLRGPEKALELFETCLSRYQFHDEVIDLQDPYDVDLEYEILSSQPNSRLVYTRRSEGANHKSIPYVAARHAGDGVLCQAERRENQYVWRVLVDDEDSVASMVEELQDGLRDGVSLHVQRLSDPDYWTADGIDLSKLPHEQQAALEAAVEYGYYERPREHSLQEIAELIGVPNSTFQYRLRRAEAWLATEFASTSDFDTGAADTTNQNGITIGDVTDSGS